MRTIPYFINDERVEGAGDLLVFNPATGEVNAHVPVADAKLVDEVVAIARARRRQTWRNSTLSQRTNILFTLRQLLVEHADELAAIITTSTARPSPTPRANWPEGSRTSSTPAASPST